ncbi:acyl carrier protein [Streptomyces sp. NPDC086182]|uniref:acyl carrier protein n=1 Tax=Streptomyces sp. NPDC086182 TaxID=3155058 RepID=UPI0034402EA9
MSALDDRVKKIVAETFGADPTRVRVQSSFSDDLGADDLAIQELFASLEAEFGTKIPAAEARKITSVRAAIDYLDRHQA